MTIYKDDTAVEKVNLGAFAYSAVKLETLEETAYTLAVVVVDRSTSTGGFADAMAAAVEASHKSIANPKINPMADNVLIRLLTVDDEVQEQHGFVPVTECVDFSAFPSMFQARGMTAFYDGLIDAASSVADFAKRLRDAKYLVNAIIVGVTDGMNNAGRYSQISDVVHVKAAFDRLHREELVESFDAFLIGVGTKGNPEVVRYLEALRSGAGFPRDVINVEDATQENIAKVGLAIAESVSSASQALGTGGPSQSTGSIKFS